MIDMKISKRFVKLFTVGLFILIPVLCVVIFFLPREMQDLLVIKSDCWNPPTFITSSFVHTGLKHLSLNIFGFICSGFLLYLLNEKTGSEIEFLISLLLIIFLLPLIYGFLFMNQLSNRSITAWGLSLIVAGLVGLIIPSLGMLLEEFQAIESYLCFVASLTILMEAIIFHLYICSSPYTLAILIILLMFNLIVFWRIGKRLFNLVKNDRNEGINLILVVFLSFSIYFILILSLFPNSIAISGGNVVNIVAHASGVILGAIFGTFVFSASKKLWMKRSKAELKDPSLKRLNKSVLNVINYPVHCFKA